jgi:hypothetical protein
MVTYHLIACNSLDSEFAAIGGGLEKDRSKRGNKKFKDLKKSHSRRA